MTAPPPAAELVMPRFEYETYSLANGLVVVLAPDSQTNMVAVDVRYFAGALDEPPNKVGLAHLAEHASFLLEASSGSTLAARLDAAALRFNGWTSYDRTHYTSVVLGLRLEEVLSLEAERMSSSCERLSEPAFIRERAVVGQELAQREMGASARMVLQRAIWGNRHRLAATVGGRDVSQLTRQDACLFLQENYRPDRAILVVSGAFELAQARAMVARHFQPLARRAAVEARPALRAPIRGPQVKVPMQMSSLAVALAFPLGLEGTSRRLQQSLSFPALHGAIDAMLPYTRGALDGGLMVLGSMRDPVAVLYMVGEKDADPAHLIEALHEATRIAAKYLGGLEQTISLQGTQRSLVSRRLVVQDSLFSRGAGIADYYQGGNGAYRGQDLEQIFVTTAQDLSRAISSTFHRDHARRIVIEPQEGEETLEGLSPLSTEAEGDAAILDVPPSLRVERTALPALHVPHAARSDLSELRLSNGLRLLLVPRRGAAFEARMIFPVGTAADPRGREGVARLTAELLESPGGEDSSSESLSMAAAESSGASLSADVHSSTTEFRITGFSQTAKLHLWHLKTVLYNGKIKAARLRRYQDATRAVLDARRRSSRAELREKEQRFQAASWTPLLGAGHPYLRAHLSQDLRLSIADLANFREEHYVASGAVLVVVGDFEYTDMLREVNRLWGVWPIRPRAPRALIPPAAPVMGPSYVAYPRPGRQLEILVRFASQSSPVTDGPARRVLAELVRMRVAELRERLAVTYGVSVDYMDTAAGSFLEVKGRIAEQRAAEALRTLIADVDLSTLSTEERRALFERASRLALERSLATGASAASLARSIAYGAIKGLPLDHEARAAAAIASLTLDSVIELARRDLDSRRMAVTVRGPGAVEVLRSAGAGAVTEIE